MGGGESYRPAADNGHFEGQLVLRASGIDVDRVPRFRTVSLGQKALERTDRDWPVDLSATAGGLAGMRAYAAADAGQWIGFTGKLIGFFKSTFRDQRDIAARVGVRGTGHHAGKVGVQPIPVHLLVL